MPKVVIKDINQALLLNLFVEIASNLDIGLPTVQISRYVWYANLRIMLKVLQIVKLLWTTQYSVQKSLSPHFTWMTSTFMEYPSALSSRLFNIQGQYDVGSWTLQQLLKKQKNPYETKEICKQIQFNEHLESQKAKVMKEILTSKINQCISFKEGLLNSVPRFWSFLKLEIISGAQG